MIPEPETIQHIEHQPRGLVPPGMTNVWQCGMLRGAEEQ